MRKYVFEKSSIYRLLFTFHCHRDFLYLPPFYICIPPLPEQKTLLSKIISIFTHQLYPSVAFRWYCTNIATLSVNFRISLQLFLPSEYISLRVYIRVLCLNVTWTLFLNIHTVRIICFCLMVCFFHSFWSLIPIFISPTAFPLILHKMRDF